MAKGEPGGELVAGGGMNLLVCTPSAYGERELSYLIGQIEHDFSHTKRLLEVKRMVTRADGIFEFTDLGEAMWRVEHFIRQSKLESVQPEPSSGARSP